MLRSCSISSVRLEGLRARALAATLRRCHRPPPLTRPRALAAVAESVEQLPQAEAWGGAGGDDSQAALKRSIAALLEAGRPTVAAHLLAEEWTTTFRGLEDEKLSKELVVQLARDVNTAAALEVLPVVTSSPGLVAEVLRVLAARGSLRGIRALLQHAREAGVAAGPRARELWRAAIVGLGSLRRPDEARAAFVDMKAAGAWEVGDTATVNLLLNALAGDIRTQFVRFNQLRQAGVAPDTSTINCLLKACMKARDVKRAGLAWGWLEAAGLQPDEITFNTLLKVHSYSGDFDGVLAVWRRLEARGMQPTPKLWGSLLMACSAAGQLEQCHIFWWEMRTLHAQQQQQARAAAAAAATAATAAANGAPPPPSQQPVQQQQRQQAQQQQQQQQQPAGKRRKAQRQPADGAGVLTTDNTCAMMTACNDAGQYERALVAFEEARALGVPMDTRAYNLALRACHTPGKTLRQEQLLQAFSLFDDLKRCGLRPDTFTFATLFSLCAAARQGHCALELHQEMLGAGVQENVIALTALAKALGATPGMAPDLLRIFRRMQRGPARVKPNHGTYRTVIAALREQGQLAEALRVYAAMRRAHPADNAEFLGLTAVAAERALKSEDAELRAAVAGVLSITSAREVELHGMSGVEARAAVLCVLALLQQEHRDTGTVAHDCALITGRGKGSAGGEPVVRQEVLALLERLRLRLPPEALAANPGRIVLPRQLLSDAVRARVERRAQAQEAAAAQEAAPAQEGAGAGPQ